MEFIKNFLIGFADKFANSFEVYSRILQTTKLRVNYGRYDSDSRTLIDMMNSKGEQLFTFLLKPKYYNDTISEEYKYVWDNLLSKHKPLLEWLNAHNIKVSRLEDSDILEKERVDLDIRITDKGNCAIYPTIRGGYLEEVIKYD